MKNPALEHILLAENHFLNGKKYDAIAEYEKAIAIDPDDALPYCRLGALFKIIGQENMSLDMYIKSIELDPNRYEGHYGLGQYYLSVLGNYPQAVHELQIADKLAPRSPDVLFILGLSLFSAGAKNEALAKLKASVELGLNPQSAELAHRVMGEIGNESTDFAAWLLTHIIQDEQPFEEPDPNYFNDEEAAEVLYGRAARLHIHNSTSNSLSEYEHVISLYSKAIERDHSKAHFFRSRGSAYLDLDNYSKALSDYDTALNLGCETPAIFFLRGTCFEELGKIERAHAVYTEGIETHPLDPDCYFAVGRLYLYSVLVLQPLGDLDLAAQNMGKAFELDTQSVSHKQYFECIQDVKKLQIGRSITQVRRTQLRISIQALLKTTKTENASYVYSDGGYYHKSICSDLKLESLFIGEEWAERIFEPCPKCIGSEKSPISRKRGMKEGRQEKNPKTKNRGLNRYIKVIDDFIRKHDGEWNREDLSALYASIQSDSFSHVDANEHADLLEERKTVYLTKRGESVPKTTDQNRQVDETMEYYRNRRQKKRSNSKENKNIKFEKGSTNQTSDRVTSKPPQPVSHTILNKPNYRSPKTTTTNRKSYKPTATSTSGFSGGHGCAYYIFFPIFAISAMGLSPFLGAIAALAGIFLGAKMLSGIWNTWFKEKNS
jgi:tetratricopeptide (TPR) repeat protein